MGRSSLRRKIWVAFVWQVTTISLAAILGIYGTSAFMRHVLIQRVLQNEAVHFWERRQADPQAQVPDTLIMNGYLGLPGVADDLPQVLQGLAPGFHTLPDADPGALVWVDDHQGQRLWLVVEKKQIDLLAFWLGIAPLALVLTVVYIIAWTAYRRSKRAVSPVVWLAQQVEHWDPDHPNVEAIKPENLSDDVEGETLALASSLHEFATRIGKFVERERNFTRDLSHELRTPLTVIRMASDMMADEGSLSPLSQRSLNRIRAAGRDMEALVESFLILAREGDTGLPEEDFPVSRVVRDEIEKARPFLGCKPIELRLQQVADFQLHAPSPVLSVMLGNILRNACYYTETGSITVKVERGRIAISDTGVGISKEELAKIFEPFFRAGDRKTEGQGIGLSIVHRLAERYGWPVKLESEVGEGTTATIEFPKVLQAHA